MRFLLERFHCTEVLIREVPLPAIIQKQINTHRASINIHYPAYSSTSCLSLCFDIHNHNLQQYCIGVLDSWCWGGEVWCQAPSFRGRDLVQAPSFRGRGLVPSPFIWREGSVEQRICTSMGINATYYATCQWPSRMTSR